MEKEYRFDGNTIKLTEKDYDRWANSFKHINNLDAVLQARDDWLSYDADPKTAQRWSLSTSSYLAKLDRKYAIENLRDDQNRKIDAEGRPVFKTAP